jgi:hypothetical protein
MCSNFIMTHTEGSKGFSFLDRVIRTFGLRDWGNGIKTECIVVLWLVMNVRVLYQINKF